MLQQGLPSDSTPNNISLLKPTSTKTSPPTKIPNSNPNDTQRGNDPTDPNQVYDTLQSVSWFTTYRAGFVNACVLLLTIAALLTIFFYFLIPTIPWMPDNTLSVLIAGLLSAFFATAIIAFFRRSAATYQEGNEQSYSNCEISLTILKSRLTIMKRIDYTPPPENETLEDRLLREVGIKEAESSLCEAMSICKSSNCYQWISGAGYAHLQRALNHVEEALIKFEPTSILISEAKHDQAALHEANISNNIQLSDELQQAIEDLNAHYTSPNQKKNIVDFLQEKFHHFLHNHQRHQGNQQQQRQQAYTQKQKSNTDASLKEKERQARISIHHVRQTLNDFRINRLFELVQQRSNLVLAITVTGAMTYILVCLALLISPKNLYTIFLSGTAYFIVGASAGLFGRLYSVSTANRTSNSYGLPTARTNTVVHLSGIAGVGGVFVTQALFQITNLTYPGLSQQPFAFSLPNLLIAATFGLTPNLLIKNLQKQAEKSISDLESTKPSVIGKDDNS